MLENIGLSFQGIWNHKTRSLLTMLGIIIGIAAIITIVSTIKGTNDQIKQNLIGSGNNVVTVTIKSTNDSYVDLEYGPRPEGVGVVDDEVIEGLLEIENLDAASSYVSRSWANGVYYKNTAFEGGINGIDRNYFSVQGYRLNYGRMFVDDDFKQHKKVVIIDTKAMRSVFDGADPLGAIMEFMGEPFTVVGVVENTSKSNVVINSVNDYYTYTDSSGGTVFMPIDTWSVCYKYDEPRTVVVKASSTDEMTTVGDAAANYLTGAVITGSQYQYKADNLLEQASELQALSQSTSQQLIWIAGISLLVGGIGVMNIMLVSVSERTREIGLKKAIGAKKRRILGQFLTEAAVLTSLGGLLGVLSGIGLAKLLSNVIGTPAAISVPSCVIAVVFSMVIGIVFGLIPAVKAARLNPIEALRRD